MVLETYPLGGSFSATQFDADAEGRLGDRPRTGEFVAPTSPRISAPVGDYDPNNER